MSFTILHTFFDFDASHGKHIATLNPGSYTNQEAATIIKHNFPDSIGFMRYGDSLNNTVYVLSPNITRDNIRQWLQHNNYNKPHFKTYIIKSNV
jgi:transposase-like protein